MGLIHDTIQSHLPSKDISIESSIGAVQRRLLNTLQLMVLVEEKLDSFVAKALSAKGGLCPRGRNLERLLPRLLTGGLWIALLLVAFDFHTNINLDDFFRPSTRNPCPCPYPRQP